MPTLKSRIGAVLIPRLPISRRAFEIIRHELRAMTTRWGNALNPGYKSTIRRLRRGAGHSLNIGSGGTGQASWVNIELKRARDTKFCYDIRRPLPLQDGSVDRILIEHVLEHVDPREDAPAMLADYHRLLRPGGVLRIIVPDAARFLEAYVTRDAEKWRALGWDPDALPDDIPTLMGVLNHTFHQGGEHLAGYDMGTLEQMLEVAGFGRTEKMSYGVSLDEALAIDQAVHAPYSLYVDAVK